MIQELKPCPFCGGCPELDYDGEDYLVYCDCGATMGGRLRAPAEEIIAAWNKRVGEC